MTETVKNTPERIWACMGGPMVGMFVSGGYTADWPQYLRADIADQAIEALRRLRQTARLLQQNSEGCAINHCGEDFQAHGIPGWLADTLADIEVAETAIALVDRRIAQPSSEGWSASLIGSAGRTPMSKHSFTPGPWKVIEDPFISVVTEWTVMDDDEPSSDTYHTIVHDCDYDGWVDLSVPRANARLIAASPSLYEFVSRKASEGDEDAARLIANI